jgi:hypothetical protein
LAGNRKSRARELDDPDPLYVAVEQIETHIYGYKSNLAETKVYLPLFYVRGAHVTVEGAVTHPLSAQIPSASLRIDCWP